ncbi:MULTISPECIES: hypothetical protein [Lysobacter]|uniref:hypothetical protein n=1 Tax=Lysobacter TaxID=68 RepID=UPI001F3ECB5D|nr:MULTISPECIES: hypothetical protein [Lysobacter]UJB19178.1 hypothetical protein L1A79_23180 [Lysobacter capsici]UJQ27097.1 hypothetical protein L2D09_16705 [Lysobacter gummosus]
MAAAKPGLAGERLKGAIAVLAARRLAKPGAEWAVHDAKSDHSEILLDSRLELVNSHAVPGGLVLKEDARIAFS